MSLAERDRVSQEFEFWRRRAEAASALLLLHEHTCGAFIEDDVRVAAWGRKVHNWSAEGSRRKAHLARAFTALPRFARASLEGRIGTAQMQAVAALAVNSRVAASIATADELFTRSAQELSHGEFAAVLLRWARAHRQPTGHPPS